MDDRTLVRRVLWITGLGVGMGGLGGAGWLGAEMYWDARYAGATARLLEGLSGALLGWQVGTFCGAALGLLGAWLDHFLRKEAEAFWSANRASSHPGIAGQSR